MTGHAFETPRLRIRPLATDDEALFCDLYTDPDTMRFIARPMSRRQALATFRATLHVIADGSSLRFFTIIDKAAACVIGVCAIQPVDRDKRQAEIGIMLKRDARGRSYGTETFAALVSQALEALPIDSVWVQYHPANAAAARLFARLGFLPETEAAFRPRGVRRTQCVSAMQRSAWRLISTTKSRGQHDVEHHQFS